MSGQRNFCFSLSSSVYHGTPIEKYLKALQRKAPQINLPFTKNYELILCNYVIDNLKPFNIEFDPRKTAVCKYCGCKIDIIYGSNVASSYTSILTQHLRKHKEQWNVFLDSLAMQMIPDIKTKFEHFQQMQGPSNRTDEQLTLGIRE